MPGPLVAVLTLALAPVLAVAAAAAQPPGPPSEPRPRGPATRVSCVVRDNGAPASGTVIVRDGAREVAKGSCGTPLSVPPGVYRAHLRLDGALDRPEQVRQFTARPGRPVNLEAAFETGTLEINVMAAGRRAAGMAVILRDGQRIGSVGTGVSARLTVGSYVVVVRYRSQEKRFEDVSLAAGQARRVRASF